MIFWNANGVGWSIGKAEFLKTGAYWHNSGPVSTQGPWASPWTRGVTVECLRPGPSSDNGEESEREKYKNMLICLM